MEPKTALMLLALLIIAGLAIYAIKQKRGVKVCAPFLCLEVKPMP